MMTNDELYQRFQILEARLNTVTVLQSHRIARLERQRAAEQEPLARADEEASIRLVKTVDFHLCSTVAEMATYFEVNPEAIRAHLYDYAHHMANDQIADYCRSPWPRGITKIDILSTDLVEVT